MANRSYGENFIIESVGKIDFDNYLLSQWFKWNENLSNHKQKYDIQLINILDESEKYKNDVYISPILKIQTYIIETGKWTAKILGYHVKTGFWVHEVVIWNNSESKEKLTWFFSDKITILFNKEKRDDFNILKHLITTN